MCCLHLKPQVSSDTLINILPFASLFLKKYIYLCYTEGIFTFPCALAVFHSFAIISVWTDRPIVKVLHPFSLYRATSRPLSIPNINKFWVSKNIVYVYYHFIKRRVFLTHKNPFISQIYRDPETAVTWEYYDVPQWECTEDNDSLWYLPRFI